MIELLLLGTVNMEEHLAGNRFILFIMISFLYCTPVVAGKKGLKFIMLGDIGGVPFRPYSTTHQRFISQKIAKVRDVDFFMGLGDNFYFNGVKDVNDQRFVSTFENVYAYPTLEKDWYMIAGNHDYNGNVSAQILYSKKSKRWKFPHYFYTKVFNIPNTNKTLQIVMIDTMLLCGRSLKRNENVPRPDEHLKWLTRTLENSIADYLIVGGHYPMFSAGVHGPIPCVQKQLENLFNKHRVTAYFSGHDHNLQHIKPEKSSVEYFVSGAGNFNNPWQLNRYKLEPNSLKQFNGKSPGFLVLTATAKHLKVKFVTIHLPSQRYRRLLLPRNQQGNQSNNIKYPQLLLDFFQSPKSTFA